MLFIHKQVPNRMVTVQSTTLIEQILMLLLYIHLSIMLLSIKTSAKTTVQSTTIMGSRQCSSYMYLETARKQDGSSNQCISVQTPIILPCSKCQHSQALKTAYTGYPGLKQQYCCIETVLRWPTLKQSKLTIFHLLSFNQAQRCNAIHVSVAYKIVTSSQEISGSFELRFEHNCNCDFCKED